MFTSQNNFNSSELAVLFHHMIWFVGEDVETGFKYLPVWNIELEQTAKNIVFVGSEQLSYLLTGSMVALLIFLLSFNIRLLIIQLKAPTIYLTHSTK